MINFGQLALDGSPRIAVPFRDGNDPASIARAVQLGMHIAELRIDQFSYFQKQFRASELMESVPRVLAEVDKFSGIPLLATIRSLDEGGWWTHGEAWRQLLYENLLPHVDAIDVEIDTIIVKEIVASAHKKSKPVVLSFHDFERTPSLDALERIAKIGRDAGADVVKIAAMCNSQDDVRTLTRFTLDHAHEGVVVIGMGPIGITTRVLLPALGSLFTFAAYGEGTAPGQLQLEDMAPIFAKLYPAL